MHKRRSLGALVLTSACLTSVASAQTFITSINLGPSVQVAAPTVETTNPGVSGVTQVSYAGQSQSVNSFIAGTAEFRVESQATSSFVRRRSGASGSNVSTLWYANNGTPGSFLSARATDFDGMVLGNNVLRGADNLFINGTGSGPGNIERLDFVFSNAISQGPNYAFAVFDRGNTLQHDAFKIALITGWDADRQAPTSYSRLLQVGPNWGPTNVTSNFTAGMVRYSGTTGPASTNTFNVATASGTGNPPNDVGNELPLNSGTFISTTAQGLGGVMFQFSNFNLAPNQQVFGYSLFGFDVVAQPDGSPALNWTTYPSNTNGTTSGGIDIAGVNGILFTIVPEPSTFALGGVIMAAFGAALRRRPRSSMGAAGQVA